MRFICCRLRHESLLGQADELTNYLDQIRILRMDKQRCENVIIFGMILLVQLENVEALHAHEPLVKKSVAALLAMVGAVADDDDGIAAIGEDSAENGTYRICYAVVLRGVRTVSGVEVEGVYIAEVRAVIPHVEEVGHVNRSVCGGELIGQIVDRTVLIRV